jgi:hypothetical protein
VLDDVSGSTVSGVVRSVDTRRGRLQVYDEYDRRTTTLRVDGRTRVVHQPREYPVSALERGDVVRIRVERTGGGELVAEHIDVRESVRQRDDGYGRGGDYGRTQRLDGTVTQVDVRRNTFVLEQGRSNSYVVHVPSRVSRDDERRFDRLRRGDRARVEVRIVGRNQAELVRFR